MKVSEIITEQDREYLTDRLAQAVRDVVEAFLPYPAPPAGVLVGGRGKKASQKSKNAKRTAEYLFRQRVDAVIDNVQRVVVPRMEAVTTARIEAAAVILEDHVAVRRILRRIYYGEIDPDHADHDTRVVVAHANSEITAGDGRNWLDEFYETTSPDLELADPMWRWAAIHEGVEWTGSYEEAKDVVLIGLLGLLRSFYDRLEREYTAQEIYDAAAPFRSEGPSFEDMPYRLRHLGMQQEREAARKQMDLWVG